MILPSWLSPYCLNLTARVHLYVVTASLFPPAIGACEVDRLVVS